MSYPGITRTHGKTWHANGRQASLSAAHGSTYQFNWDNADRLQSIVIPGEGVIAYSEYQWHQPTEIQFPGGTVRQNSFDGLQRHTGILVSNDSGQVLMNYQYTWDITGNITQKATEHGLYQYGYDDIDRLTEAQYPTFSAEEWTYDPLGNRLTDQRTGEAPWQYNDNNELLDSVEFSYAYDANGSLIAENHSDGSLFRSHEYNAETRLIAVRDASDQLIAEYTYDPFGRRIRKTVYDPPGQNPETTWYLYSDQGLMAELDGQGNQLDFYLFPPDGLWSTDPIARRTGTSYLYYQTDHLGTPKQLIDSAGSVVHSREMRAFGEVLESGIEDRLRFPGQLHSQETGLYYNYFRDYAPNTARYLQIDPIGLQGGLNIYGYAVGNPLLWTDSYGLQARSDFYGNEPKPWERPPAPWPTCEELCTTFKVSFSFPDRKSAEAANKQITYSSGAACILLGTCLGLLTVGVPTFMATGIAAFSGVGCMIGTTERGMQIFPGDRVELEYEVCCDALRDFPQVKVISFRHIKAR